MISNYEWYGDVYFINTTPFVYISYHEIHTSISHKVCTRDRSDLLYYGYVIVLSASIWFIYSYHSRLFQCGWSASEATLPCMSKIDWYLIENKHNKAWILFVFWGSSVYIAFPTIAFIDPGCHAVQQTPGRGIVITKQDIFYVFLGDLWSIVPIYLETQLNIWTWIHLYV